MPWKDRYTTSDERTLDRVEWPDGASCALVVTVDLSPSCGPDGITPQELAAEDTEYGMHVGVRAQATAPQQPEDAGADGGHEVSHLRIGGRRQAVKLHGIRRGRGEHAVEHERVVVDVQIERSAKALDDRQAPAPAVADAEPARSPALAGINVKVIAAISAGRFDRQPDAYRHAVRPPGAPQDLMFVSSGTRRLWPLRNVGSPIR